MCQIAGGAIGLGLNTAIVASASSLADGISHAFKVDAVLAVAGLLLVLAVIGRHEEATPPCVPPHPPPRPRLTFSSHIRLTAR